MTIDRLDAMIVYGSLHEIEEAKGPSWASSRYGVGVAMKIDPKAAWVSVRLRELGIPLNVATKRDRIAMQKAIYLAQRKGADLGYRFSWYLNGPYSTAVADTYYLLDQDPEPYAGYSADADFKRQLEPVRQLISAKPEAANLADWMEAVGSLDFMVKVMARSMEDSLERCKKEKPHLEALFEPARDALIAHGFQTNAA